MTKAEACRSARHFRLANNWNMPPLLEESYLSLYMILTTLWVDILQKKSGGRQ